MLFLSPELPGLWMFSINHVPCMANRYSPSWRPLIGQPRVPQECMAEGCLIVVHVALSLRTALKGWGMPSYMLKDDVS